MPPSFSVYLDLLRLFAAFLVYLGHSNRPGLTDQPPLASGYAHAAVVVFFVMSGYVIAYTTEVKDRTWVRYVSSRVSRIYTVAVPAVLLTMVLDSVARPLNPELYTYPFDQLVVRALASVLMLNEVWFVSITSFSNAPYWSIAYEAWYYAAFGVVSFLPQRWHTPALVAACLLMGPKMLLLLPIWWLGAWLYRSRSALSLSTATLWLLLLASGVGIGSYFALAIYVPLAEFTESLLGPARFGQLAFSRWFLGDYLLATLVAAHLAAVRGLSCTLLGGLLRVEGTIRWLSSHTLTLYLVHQPLMLFWAAWVGGDPHDPSFWWLVTGLTFASVLLFGQLTEQRRHAIRLHVEVLFERLNVRLRAGFGP